MDKKKTVIFLRKKRSEANSIEEIFYSLIKYLGHDVELLELPLLEQVFLLLSKTYILRGNIVVTSII